MTAEKKEKFETALARLEQIVKKLEQGETPLEDSMKAFEEGMRLVRICEARLSEAAKKVEILKKRDGKMVVEGFEVEE